MPFIWTQLEACANCRMAAPGRPASFRSQTRTAGGGHPTVRTRINLSPNKRTALRNLLVQTFCWFGIIGLTAAIALSGAERWSTAADDEKTETKTDAKAETKKKDKPRELASTAQLEGFDNWA